MNKEQIQEAAEKYATKIWGATGTDFLLTRKAQRSIQDFIAGFEASTQQGCGARWVKASEQLPSVGIYNALYNGDHIIFQVHDGGFRVINYHGEKNDSPKLNLIKWLDESSPCQCRELREALEAWQQWESDIISDDKAWPGNEMTISGKHYDRMLQLQVMRNKALSSTNQKEEQ